MLTLHTIYIVACILFMVSALCFIGVDPRCTSSRIGWLVATMFTGPIGLIAYLYIGRR